VSVLGFGCGQVGGLMIRAGAAERERAVRTAVDRGVTYFDTAADYGDGLSEENLGRALRGVSGYVVVGTKVGITGLGTNDVARAIVSSVDRSLARLGRDQLDLLQLHYWISADGNGAPGLLAARTLTADRILSDAVPMLNRLRDDGKVRACGFSGIGDTAGVLRLIEVGAFDTVQLPFNVLNPSGLIQLEPRSDVPDLGQAINRAAEAGLGVLAIRVLGGGALSGSGQGSARNFEPVHPIASYSYHSDVLAAQELSSLIADGHARDLVDLALRFAVTPPQISTALLGIAEIDELESAVSSVERGPLPADVCELITSAASLR
jgi:aryl-alcohol dehydrogenase-like predicted oxidoreductase